MSNQKKYVPYNDWTEHKRAEETVNDQISIDVDKTIQEWLDDGYVEMDPKDIISQLKPEDNLKVRYVTTDMMCRKGGILTGVINETFVDDGTVIKQFIRLKNHVANVCWSVQIHNIYKLYWKKITPKSTNKKFSEVETLLIVEAIDEAKKTLNTVSADRIYKYIKEHKFLDVPRTYVRNYMRNEKIN